MIPRPAFRTLTAALRHSKWHQRYPNSRSLLSLQQTPRRTYASSSSKHPEGFVQPTSEDLEELRERTIEFASKTFLQQFVVSRREISPDVAAKTDRENQFPMDLWKKLGDAGFLGITTSSDYTGLNLGYLAHIIVMEELSRASASIALSYAAHSQLCINQLSLNGSPMQKSKFLPPLIAGSKVGALAMSETGAGSDVVGMRTTATKTDDGYLLNGSKMWITNGPDAHTIIVYAKTQPDAGSKGITAFIVEAPTKGFSCSRKLDKLGMRGSNTGELHFEDVFVPHDNVLGTEDRGVRVLMEGLDIERLVLSAGPLGIMQACLDLVMPFVHTRSQFNQPLASFQLIQDHISTLYTSLASSRAFTYSVARDLDNGSSNIKTEDCAAAILLAAENATRCALLAVQCLGGMGYVNEMPAGRLLRDAKLYEIGAGTTEVRKLVIARALNRRWRERNM
ncbi:MAG: hypothetical protein M1834_004292 [Cirrosporium novae-zelandiae]|nr:MAG: hypothetical protein M1834_004292 [Cirrosporium novae-zelandiae]